MPVFFAFIETRPSWLPLLCERERGCETPLQEGYFSDTCAIPHENKTKDVRYPPLQKYAFLSKTAAAEAFFFFNGWDCRNLVGPSFFFRRAYLGNTLYFNGVLKSYKFPLPSRQGIAQHGGVSRTGLLSPGPVSWCSRLQVCIARTHHRVAPSHGFLLQIL